jgi:hypothetical protein
MEGRIEMTELKEGCKVISVFRGKMYSWVMESGEGGTFYKPHEWIYPLEKHGPLCVFGDITKAIKYDAIGKCGVWFCLYEESDETDVYNNRGDRSPLERLMDGTRLAKKVMLIAKCDMNGKHRTTLKDEQKILEVLRETPEGALAFNKILYRDGCNTPMSESMEKRVTIVRKGEIESWDQYTIRVCPGCVNHVYGNISEYHDCKNEFVEPVRMADGGWGVRTVGQCQCSGPAHGARKR